MEKVVHLIVLNDVVNPAPHWADTFDRDGYACPICHELAFEAYILMTEGGCGFTAPLWDYNIHPTPETPYPRFGGFWIV